MSEEREGTKDEISREKERSTLPLSEPFFYHFFGISLRGQTAASVVLGI
jgi:hypothetical protein